MLNNFELRFVNREVAGRHIVSDIHEAKIVKILQYRTSEPPDMYEHRKWTEWQNVPTEESGE